MKSILTQTNSDKKVVRITFQADFGSNKIRFIRE